MKQLKDLSYLQIVTMADEFEKKLKMVNDCDEYLNMKKISSILFIMNVVLIDIDKNLKVSEEYADLYQELIHIIHFIKQMTYKSPLASIEMFNEFITMMDRPEDIMKMDWS